jgi:putative chitinase
MTTEQTNNIKLITASLNKFGVTNPNIQAGILATISKESNFVPQSENLNYSVANIKRVWPNTPDAKATELAKSPTALGDYKYGGKYGNAQNEGYKYRGRGFNQITFKNTYKKIGDAIGVNLVDNPDALNKPEVAADAVAAFFAPELKAGINAGSFKKFGVTDLSSINDTITGTKVAVQINAGRGTDFNNSVVQEGFNKAKDVADSLYDMIKSGATTAKETVKAHPIITIGATVFIVFTGYLIYGFFIKKK